MLHSNLYVFIYTYVCVYKIPQGPLRSVGRGGEYKESNKTRLDQVHLNMVHIRFIIWKKTRRGRIEKSLAPVGWTLG